jgi:hypothetical protein
MRLLGYFPSVPVCLSINTRQLTQDAQSIPEDIRIVAPDLFVLIDRRD